MGFSGALESARRELFYPRNPRQILYGSGSSGLGFYIKEKLKKVRGERERRNNRKILSFLQPPA